MNELVLGIDGGGSKTIAILVNRSGELEQVSRSTGINPQDRADWKLEFSNLADALKQRLPRVESACIGAPGYGEIPSISALQNEFFKTRFSCPVIVENDVRLAFDGAFLGAAGILLLVGTGTMAWASDGVSHARFGGWGDIYGDEGSGFWIGRQTLSIASRQLDGRLPPESFSQDLLRHLSIDPDRGAEHLCVWAYEHAHRRSAIAALSRFVSAQAISGNSTARQLLTEACQRMGEHIVAAKNMFGSAIPWSVAGGISKIPYVLQCLTQDFGIPRTRQLPPVGGGAWRAALALGWNTGQDWIQRLQKSLAEHGVDS